jgi:hypothetical protein
LVSGRVEEILGRLQSKLELELEVRGDVAALIELLERHCDVSDVRRSGERVCCVWQAERDDLPELHRALVAAGIPLVSFAAKEDDLEAIYMKISRHRTS